MSQQPEALRLADALQAEFPGYEVVDVTAAELRRLHAVNEELLAREKRWMELADIEVARCDKLQAINAQLLEALEALYQYGDFSNGNTDPNGQCDEGVLTASRIYRAARKDAAAAESC